MMAHTWSLEAVIAPLVEKLEAAVADAAASANAQTALIDELPRDVARRFQNHPGFFGEPWYERKEIRARLRAALNKVTNQAGELQSSLGIESKSLPLRVAVAAGEKAGGLAERTAARLRRVLQAAAQVLVDAPDAADNAVLSCARAIMGISIGSNAQRAEKVPANASADNAAMDTTQKAQRRGASRKRRARNTVGVSKVDVARSAMDRLVELLPELAARAGVPISDAVDVPANGAVDRCGADAGTDAGADTRVARETGKRRCVVGGIDTAMAVYRAVAIDGGAARSLHGVEGAKRSSTGSAVAAVTEVVRTALEDELHPRLPRCPVNVYGSSVSGFALRSVQLEQVAPAAATTSTKPSAAGGDHIARDVDICVELSWVLRDVAKVDRQVTEACHAYIRAERAAPALAAARRDVARAEQDLVAATKRQRHVAHESGGSEKQAAVARLEKELERARSRDHSRHARASAVDDGANNARMNALQRRLDALCQWVARTDVALDRVRRSAVLAGATVDERHWTPAVDESGALSSILAPQVAWPDTTQGSTQLQDQPRSVLVTKLENELQAKQRRLAEWRTELDDTTRALHAVKQEKSKATARLEAAAAFTTTASSAMAAFERPVAELQRLYKKHVKVGRAIFSVAAPLKAGSTFDNLQLVTHARVPVIKCRHAETKTDVDVVVNNSLGVHNSAMLREYAESDWRAHALGLVVKRWAKQQGVADASMGTLSSYCWVLMVLHFCMAHGHIACLQSKSLLAHAKSCGHVVQGGSKHKGRGGGAGGGRIGSRVQHNGRSIDVAFCTAALARRRSTDLDSQRQAAPLGQLVADFFEYFDSEFDFARNTMLVRPWGQYESTKRDAGAHSGAVKMCCFVAPKAALWPRPRLWRFSVQDPFDATHDLGIVLTEIGWAKVRSRLREASLALREGHGDMSILALGVPHIALLRRADEDETKDAAGGAGKVKSKRESKHNTKGPAATGHSKKRQPKRRKSKPASKVGSAFQSRGREEKSDADTRAGISSNQLEGGQNAPQRSRPRKSRRRQAPATS